MERPSGLCLFRRRRPFGIGPLACEPATRALRALRALRRLPPPQCCVSAERSRFGTPAERVRTRNACSKRVQPRKSPARRRLVLACVEAPNGPRRGRAQVAHQLASPVQLVAAHVPCSPAAPCTGTEASTAVWVGRGWGEGEMARVRPLPCVIGPLPRRAGVGAGGQHQLQAASCLRGEAGVGMAIGEEGAVDLPSPAAHACGAGRRASERCHNVVTRRGLPGPLGR